jgi:FkbM family methyltransferase
MPKRVEFEGWKLDLELPSNIDTEIERGDWYDLDVAEWIKEHVKPGMNCIDAGANWGLFTLLMAKQAGYNGLVHAFEPAPQFYKRLGHHVRINNIQNVIAYQEALGDILTTAVCTVNGTPYRSSATVDFDRHQPEYENECCVPSNRIDDYWCEEYGSLGFIKIDVDGCEERLLLGAEKTIEEHQPKIVIELEISDIGFRAAEWLIARGYRFQAYKDRTVDLAYIKEKRGHGSGTVNILALPN